MQFIFDQHVPTSPFTYESLNCFDVGIIPVFETLAVVKNKVRVLLGQYFLVDVSIAHFAVRHDLVQEA